MANISFKEYLESKQILKTSIKESPVTETQYLITKYCKIPVFDNGELKEIKLKPRQEIVMNWLHENTDAQKLESLRFIDYMEDRIYKTKLADKKLDNWINKNTIPEKD